MSCYYPLEISDQPGRVPCGRCVGCRLERSRQWAVRIMHEAALHESNSFVTLTYAPEHLPEYGSLRKSDFQKFMKRLRKDIAPQTVRFFHCGEYGSRLGRAHYHACLFGFAFPDRYAYQVRGQHEVYRSDHLERLWPAGNSEIGELTFESAAYVARYCVKKIVGRDAADHYSVVDPETGEIVEIEQEYATMSRRPGIGRDWFDRFKADVYPSDEVIVRGVPGKPPRYYDNLLEREDAEALELVKRARKANRNYRDSTPERLAVREVVTKARLATFSQRGYDAG